MKEHLQHMAADMVAHTDAERIGIVRNTFLAAAALATAVLIALTQVGAKQTSLQIAVAGCAISAPIWLCLAVVLEVYLHLGDRSLPHFRQVRSGRPYTLLQALAGVSLYVALCGVIYFLLPWAMFAFLAASAVGAAFIAFSYARLAKWLPAAHQQSRGASGE